MEKETNSRGQWGSNFGFLMAAIGSAVGLGNIWGFPYKMGVSGGFAFLIVYLALVAFVGVIIMLGELALGRKTGLGVIGAYKMLSKKFAWVGWLGFLSGFLILGFYSVLGGYTLRYSIGFILEIFSAGAGFGGMGSGQFFGSFITNGVANVAYHAIFMVLTVGIVMGGVSSGIEKFTKIAMPALFVMLLIVIIRSVTLQGASTGVAFMFAPNFAAFREIGFMKILKTAAGQMFFSLSLGMGCMITYGSYLSKNEDLERNAIIIPVADTIFALCAGLAVMPAVGAFMSQGVEGISFGAGPGLLFVTLHQVFSVGMGGFIGNFFGFMFYFLVFIAAITSAISLLEVCTAYFIDRDVQKGIQNPNRKKHTILVGTLIFLVGIPVCLDGLGSGVAGGAMIDIPATVFGMKEVTMAFDCWLDFYDMISEGVFMPLGAILMSIMIGWVLKTDVIKEEVEASGLKMKAYAFWDICFKYVVPIAITFVLIGQLDDFFSLGIFR